MATAIGQATAAPKTRMVSLLGLKLTRCGKATEAVITASSPTMASKATS